MATKRRKLIRVLVIGTGLHEELLLVSHEIVSYPSSTYHKFTYPSGVVQYKNDFGVSSVTVTPIELSDEELEKLGF